MQYQWAMITGNGKLLGLNNADYPRITSVPVAKFLAGRE